MIFVEGPILPLIVFSWPLLLAVLSLVPKFRGKALRLLPLAPLPALLLVVTGETGVETHIPYLLLGMVLETGSVAMLLLGMTAVLWLMAGIYAQEYMAKTPNQPRFVAFWCLTLSGNLGVFLAADVATFYLAFAMVSLAAYFLIIHNQNSKALRAGRVYIVLAILGEVCLLVAFFIGVDAADSRLIADIRPVLAEAPLGGLAVGLLILGFGLKAGLFPLHVWLPLAHPAAPVPASAVLSGAIVKAGVIGLILFLPVGMAEWGMALMLMGFFAAYAGIVLGLSQSNPKTVLAYSTISQMGLVFAIIGAAITGTIGQEATAYYALHHGLAKGALFLSIGLIAVNNRRFYWLILALTALVAASIAGLPLTGGALAKAAVKPGFDGYAYWALYLSGIGSALLMVRFILLIARNADQQKPIPSLLMIVPWLVLVLAALTLPWLLWPAWTGKNYSGLLEGKAIWQTLWPVALGVALAMLAVFIRARPPRIPEGDIVVWLERFVGWIVAQIQAIHMPTLSLSSLNLLLRLRDLPPKIEFALTQWRGAGFMVMVFALLIGLMTWF